MFLLPFLLSFLLSLVLVPLVRKVSFRYGRVSKPRPDRWHLRPTPTLGGAGIFLATVVGLILSGVFGETLGQIPWGLLAGSGLMFLLGLFDDFKPITPPAKLVGQISAAALVIFFGYTTRFFSPRIADSVLAQLPNVLLTFIWLVGITNAINLLDNMDGLASGISLITAGILSFFFWKAGNGGLLAVSLALAGGISGFLIFNFPPAAIFMGDSGSLFLGFTLAALAIARQPQASNVFAVMGVPTLLFLLPILDTALVTFTRLLRGQSPAQGGRDHTSHRLIAFGLTERKAVLVLYGVALGSGVLAAALESLAYWFSLVIVPILVISLALLTAYLGGLKVTRNSSSETTIPTSGKAFTRIILELTYRQRVLEVLLDFLLISLAYYLAFLIRPSGAMDSARLDLYLRSLPIALTGVYVSFFAFGVYRGVWRFVGVDDLLRYLKAAIGGVALAALGVWLLPITLEHAVEIFLLFALFLFLGMTASRSSFRILDSISGQQSKTESERVLICGAGNAGEIALRWMLMNPTLAYQPVGILDADPFMVGRQIHGVKVFGGFEKLEALLESKKVDGVILTADVLQEGEAQAKLLRVCREHSCWVRALRLEFETLEL